MRWVEAGSIHTLVVVGFILITISHIIFLFQQKYVNILKEIKAKDIEIRIHKKKMSEIQRR